jgi:hypothetical protein
MTIKANAAPNRCSSKLHGSASLVVKVGLLRLRNHPAGKDEFLGFSIPAIFWQYSVNAAYTRAVYMLFFA